MLIEQLQIKGYSVKETPKGRYIRGVIPLLGGQYRLNILQTEPILRLFSNAQIRKGQPYTLKQLIQIAQSAQDTPQFTEHIKHLAANTALIRGYRLQCPVCDLDSWYALDAVAEVTTCQGCRNSFQLPLELDFAYIPNRLLMEALKSGALTTLLTFYKWLQESPITLWYAGLEITRDGNTTDIDLIVQREDGLFMAECKDSQNSFVNRAGQQQFIKQVQQGKQLAEMLGASYSLSSLHNDLLPPDIAAFCVQNNITILPRENLIRE